MKAVKTLIVLVVIAIFASSIAEARQLRRLKERAKERAEERLEQKADQAVDRQVDKAVDALWDETGDTFTGMLESALPKGKTTVDEEAGVVRREGRPDVTLDDNESGPADTEFLSYSMVSIVNLPSQLQALGARFGNASMEEFYLHGDRRYNGNDASGTTIDAENVSYTVYDHERKEFWTMDFEQMFASSAEALERANRQMEEQGGQAPPPSSEQPAYEMEIDVSIREGERARKRGLDARQRFVIVETVARDPEQAAQNGKFYVVAEIWTTDQFAGSATLAAFEQKMGEGVLDAMGDTDFNSSLNFAAFNDPRMKESMEKVSESFEQIEGKGVETTTWFVTVPADAELDLEAVLNPSGETDVRSFPGTTSDEPVQSQATLFSTKTFMTNLSTEPFDLSLLGDRGYTQIESPLKQYLEESGR